MVTKGCCGKADFILEGEALGRSILLATIRRGSFLASMFPTTVTLTWV